MLAMVDIGQLSGKGLKAGRGKWNSGESKEEGGCFCSKRRPYNNIVLFALIYFVPNRF